MTLEMGRIESVGTGLCNSLLHPLWWKGKKRAAKRGAGALDNLLQFEVVTATSSFRQGVQDKRRRQIDKRERERGIEDESFFLSSNCVT